MTNQVRRSALGALALGVVLSLGATAVEAQREPLLDSVTPDQVRLFLAELGHPESRLDQDRDVIVMMRGYKVLIIVGTSQGKYLEVRFSVTGSRATHQMMASWNQRKLFTAAYIDSDGDANLESDLDLEGGVTPDRIKDFLNTFDYSLAEFIGMIGA